MQKMALLEPTYISEIKPYRFPKGAIIAVDDETAARWLDCRVAEPAAIAQKTYRETRQEALLAELAELQAVKDEEAVLRQERVDMKKLTRGRRRAPNVTDPSAVVTGSTMPDVHLRRAAQGTARPGGDGAAADEDGEG